MVIPYQLDSIVGSNGKIDMLVVRDLENNIKNIKADFFLPFFGLSNELGPIKEWELDIEKKELLLSNLRVRQTKKAYSLSEIFVNTQGNSNLYLLVSQKLQLLPINVIKEFFQINIYILSILQRKV